MRKAGKTPHKYSCSQMKDWHDVLLPPSHFMCLGTKIKNAKKTFNLVILN